MALNRISELEWSKLTAKQSILLRTEVRASSQAKGLERGWKRRARLGRDGFFSLASHAQRSILRKTPTVLQSMVQVAFSFHYAFPEIKKKQMRCVLEEPCWVRRCGKGFAVWLYPQTFSSGKLSFRLTMAAENSAYRRVIWKKKKRKKKLFKKNKTESGYFKVSRRGSRMNTDRFPKRAPKVQVSRGSGGRLPQESFWIFNSLKGTSTSTKR